MATSVSLRRLCPGARRCTRRLSSPVMVSQERMKQFMRAELSYFQQRQPKPMKLEQIVHTSHPFLVARLVHTELPIRFAARIKHVESWPDWEQHRDLVEIHKIFCESFQSLRLINLKKSDLQEFTDVIYDIRRRHKAVVPLISRAMRSMVRASILEEEQWSPWADQFLLSRISTEMLTAHYIECAESHVLGIVDAKCDPAQICQQAATKTLDAFRTESNDPPVCIEVEQPPHAEKIEFSCIPQYLSYIVEELLLNSTRATLRKLDSHEHPSTRPLKVTICADQHQVAIKISDKGGGIPYGSSDRVWSYLYSTSPPPLESECEMVRTGSPLSGSGMGLPLTRLYARYLGGSCELMNMPGIGVDVYLFLSRVNPKENIDTDQEC